MTAIEFVKMQGIGNDFVVVAAESIAGLDPAAVAVSMCARRFGIGSDGLLIIGPATDNAAFSFRMHNPDGSPDMCGNGLRCAVLYAHDAGLIPANQDSVLVDTIDGLLSGSLLTIADDSQTADVRVEMAIPTLEASRIPFAGPQNIKQVVDFPLVVDGNEVEITAVNTGSTHSVIFVDELPDDNSFFSISQKIEVHPYFPERTSIMWTKRIGGTKLQIRIWERAAGETFGCGTGASAVAVASIIKGFASHNDHVEVSSLGGTLGIDWRSAEEPLWLTGPATWVYKGTFNHDLTL